jgi:hypothetical protein
MEQSQKVPYNPGNRLGLLHIPDQGRIMRDYPSELEESLLDII